MALGERISLSHRYAALHLAFDNARIDRAADIVRGDDLEELYLARGGIHLDDCRLRCVGVGREVAVLYALLLRALEISDGEALRRTEVGIGRCG